MDKYYENGRPETISTEDGVLLQQLRQSELMVKSPVKFLIRILGDFLESRCDYEEFSLRVVREIKKFKFFFFNMPKSEVRANQKLFWKEFRFADGLFEVALAAENQEETYKQVRRLLIAYFAVKTEDEACILFSYDSKSEDLRDTPKSNNPSKRPGIDATSEMQ